MTSPTTDTDTSTNTTTGTPSKTNPSPILSGPARWVAPFCVVAFLATMWPIYPLFSSGLPLVLGMPLSLFYLIVVLVLVFSTMLGLYVWESSRGKLD